LIAANKDVGFPGWDALRAENLEDEPAVIFTVRDAKGDIVRHVTGPASPGFHRVVWDLRYPALRPWQPGEGDAAADSADNSGVLVAPGTFEVTMQLRRDGKLTVVGEPRNVVVESIREATLPGTSQEERVQFAMEVAELERAVEGSIASIDAVLAELDAIKTVLDRSTADLTLRPQANKLALALQDQRLLLKGDLMRRRLGDLAAVTVTERISHAASGSSTNAYGPTPAQQESLRLARAQFSVIKDALGGRIEEELQALRRKIEVSGVPWTPGREL
jgi:hypothetical protein